jgi:hypothetical protein
MKNSASETGLRLPLWRSLVNEVRRLNSARLDRGALSKLPRREQTAMVKAALTKHHGSPNRCC